jgi:AraC-like DNA-binding protein
LRERGVTVAGWIRSRRLARCRVALTDVRQDRTITEIATKWGFSDVAHFSRTFKAASASPQMRSAVRIPRASRLIVGERMLAVEDAGQGGR